MEHGQYFDAVVVDAVNDNERGGGNDKLSRVLNAPGPPEQGIIREVPGPVADSPHDPIGRARVLAGDIISDQLEIACRRPRPDNVHAGVEYFSTIRAISSSSAKSPSSAAAIPALILSICQPCNAK